MINRSRKAFTLLELLVVVVVLGILALVAVPVFRSAIDGTTDSVVEQTALAIAREADSIAMFNAGADLGETTGANIDEAVSNANTAGNFADAGWALDSAAGSVVGCYEISLTKAGQTDTYTVDVNTSSTPDRARVQEGALCV